MLNVVVKQVAAWQLGDIIAMPNVDVFVMLTRLCTHSTMRCVHDSSSLQPARHVSRWTALPSSMAATDTSCSPLRNGERRHSCRGLIPGIIDLTLCQRAPIYCFGTVCISTFTLCLSVPTLRWFCHLRSTIQYSMIWYDMMMIKNDTDQKSCVASAVNERTNLVSTVELMNNTISKV